MKNLRQALETALVRASTIDTEKLTENQQEVIEDFLSSVERERYVLLDCQDPEKIYKEKSILHSVLVGASLDSSLTEFATKLRPCVEELVGKFPVFIQTEYWISYDEIYDILKSEENGCRCSSVVVASAL